MYDLFIKGGLVMYPLSLLSVVTFALWAHRAYLLHKCSVMKNTMSAPIEDIQKGIETLFLISSIAPLLGLLGTVFGIIKSFTALAAGRPDAQVLALGLSEALITTATGLIISIPAQIAGHFLQQKLDTIIKKIKQNFEK